MDKELIEKFQIRFGWTDEAILAIPREDVLTKMTREEFDIYIERMQKIAPRTTHNAINYYEVKDNVVLVPDGEKWDG